MEKLVGLVGIAVLLFIAIAFSVSRKSINWRLVASGLALQVAFALFVLRFEPGRKVLSVIAGAVTSVIGFADRGAEFAFGWLVTDPVPEKFIFAFKVLPIVIFLSSLFSCLYYLGVMQLAVSAMAKVMTRLMKVSGAESLAAASNVFLGQTEAPLVIAPYIPEMTRSELMALMTGGMATVSGAVLGGYIGLGVSAEHLISASVMAAPASLVMAKILVPEDKVPVTAGKVLHQPAKTEANLVDAAARGAAKGVTLAINIAAMLIAFISIVFLLNGVLGLFGEYSGLNNLLSTPLSLEGLLGLMLAPLAFLMGVPWVDAHRVGELIGVKLVLNEFVAYVDFASIRGTLSDKAALISTYALCGFANIGSVGVQIGGIGSLAPESRSELARLGFRAVLGGTLASCLNATLAGLLI